ncbi:MAG TPA: NPCBM/NEW2 domain-containing protein [Acidimicrobiales bacterium]
MNDKTTAPVHGGTAQADDRAAIEPPIPSGPPPVQPPRRKRGFKARFLRALPFTDNLVSVVAGLLAIATFAVGALGYVAKNERDERNELEEAVASLERQRDDLREANDQLGTEADELRATNEELEERLQAAEAALEEAGPGDGDEDPSTTTSTVGDKVLLADLEPVEGNVRTDPVAMGGEEYRYPVRIDLATFSVRTADYDLGRDYSRFTADVGLNDTYTDTDRAWRFKIISVGGPNGDTVLFDQTISFGTVVPVDLDVDGVLRLRLSVERAFPAPGSGGGYNAFNATWGDAALE